ncbi:hypothetical protein ACFLYK_00280, partial [Candidatus Cloacimonadota bacterium]
RVINAYANIVKLPKLRRGWYCSFSCGSNLFLAVVKHPIYSGGKAVRLNLDFLKKEQKDNGSWQGNLPFFPIFNALSNLKQNEADTLFAKALMKVRNTQNKDGSWGRVDKALKTYLVLDALDRKEIRTAM